MSLHEAAATAETAIVDIIATFTTSGAPGVVVDSPPGAGKSTLVVRSAIELADAGEPVNIVAQTNVQVDDLIDRIARKAGHLPIGRLSAGDYQRSDAVNHPNVTVAQRIADLADCIIIVGTAAKWVHVTDGRWPWAIIDEAYQMRSDMLLRIAPRFEHMLFVGDPGQLDPFSTVEEGIERWAGLPWDPMQSAVAVLLRNNPATPQRRLPLSWRLPPSATPVVQRAFYPFNGFDAATAPQMRGMAVPVHAIGSRPVDRVLDEAARTGWGFYELPKRTTLRTDAEAVRATAEIAARLLQRGTETFCEHHADGVRLTAERIAVGTAHRDQAAAVRRELLAAGAAGIRVDTANRLQGSEYDVTVVLHPLSGRHDATAFHLETGRLCVLASRHRHACIVVGREGIPELLDAHPSVEPMHLNVPVKFPDGWEANQAMLAHLGRHRVPAT